MNRIRHAAAASALALTAALAISPFAARTASAGDDNSSLAYFEGEWIDLTEGWGEAQACNVTDDGTFCYRSEREMDAAIADEGGASMLMACSSYLKLYNGTNYSGALLQLNTQGTTIALSGFGFDNLTSSYKVGACDSELYTGFGTGGYPGNTSAFAQSASMLAGYDNAISSVHIY